MSKDGGYFWTKISEKWLNEKLNCETSFYSNLKNEPILKCSDLALYIGIGLVSSTFV